VIVGSIVLILLIGIICCCSNRKIEKQLRKLEKEANGAYPINNNTSSNTAGGATRKFMVNKMQ
jgi:hypothetical protein